MAANAPPAPRLSRSEAIDLLRSELVKVTGSDTSVCKAAAARGFFCQGFRRYDDKDFTANYGWMEHRLPGMPREQLEELADRWQLARQELHQLPLACDVQSVEHDTCNGWNDFTAEELALFVRQLTRRVVVVEG
jgi:hypothetical protein